MPGKDPCVNLVKRLVLVGTLALAGCAASPTIRTESAPGVELGAFRTFSFAVPLSTDRAGFHTLVSQQLIFSTRRELEVRGFEFVADPAEADLLVNFHAQVAEQLRVRATPDPWAGPGYWHHRRGFYDPWRGHPRWPSHSRVEVDQFSQGQLSVDLIDRTRNILVWEGVASKRLAQSTMHELGPALDSAVHKMFRTFPVAAGL